MLTATTDQRVLGYLGRALSLELTAVQLYRVQARLVSNWGLSEAAARLRAESEEELLHVDRIIERMLAIGVAPNASVLRPAPLGRSLGELLEANQAFEGKLVGLYRDAVQHCARAGLHDDRMFFEGLLQDEQGHYDELLAWQQHTQQASAAAQGTATRPVRYSAMG
jgi:bacterioferritin